MPYLEWEPAAGCLLPALPAFLEQHIPYGTYDQHTYMVSFYRFWDYYLSYIYTNCLILILGLSLYGLGHLGCI